MCWFFTDKRWLLFNALSFIRKRWNVSGEFKLFILCTWLTCEQCMAKNLFIQFHGTIKILDHGWICIKMDEHIRSMTGLFNDVRKTNLANHLIAKNVRTELFELCRNLFLDYSNLCLRIL